MLRKPAEEFTVVPGQLEVGRPIFSVLVKRTYDIRPGQPAIRAEKASPLCKVDSYYDHDDPETCTVRYETDLVPYKLATDVVAIVKAHSASARPVVQVDVCFEVAGQRKIIRVTGNRKCIYRDGLPPLFTEPIAFTEMEIRYERAYGGTDARNSPAMPFSYPRNPLGAGVVLKNVREAVEGLPLPNLEDPADMLTPDRVVLGEPTRWNQQPLPQGFGWFQRTWYPRCSFVGSVPGFVHPDEVMREEVLGLVPKGQIALARQFRLPSFDVRFNNGASLGLAFPYLAGDERVRLTNATPNGTLEFSLPRDPPKIALDIGFGDTELRPVLHTVCIRSEDMQVDLVWRGAQEYPGPEWLPEMKKMAATVW